MHLNTLGSFEYTERKNIYNSSNQHKLVGDWILDQETVMKISAKSAVQKLLYIGLCVSCMVCLLIKIDL